MKVFLTLCIILLSSLALAQAPNPPSPGREQIDIKSNGAIGDGSCHPLSGLYSSLAQAQLVYPFVSDLTQCADWAAIQKTMTQAFLLGPTANDSAAVLCPVGNYQMSNPLFFDAAQNTQGTNPAWASGTTYGYQGNVIYNGIPWQSVGSGNTGNPPTSANGFPGNLYTTSPFPVAAVQVSSGSPAVVTLTGHLMSAGEAFTFQTQAFAVPPSGAAPALPAGVNANQVYYVIAAGLGANSFEFSATRGGAAVGTTSVGTGVIFINTQVWTVEPAIGNYFANRVDLI
jgi:hypothetical protein